MKPLWNDPAELQSKHHHANETQLMPLCCLEEAEPVPGTQQCHEASLALCGMRRQWQLLPNWAQLAGNRFLLTDLEAGVVSRSVAGPGGWGQGLWLSPVPSWVGWTGSSQITQYSELEETHKDH